MTQFLLPYKLFIRVARHRSFSLGAREMGLSQSSASRIIATLESDLGAKLLVRTTRAVVLTDVGTDYLSRIEPLLAEFEAANHATRASAGELRGTLRIGLTVGLAVREVIPRLQTFTHRHPDLKIDLLLDDEKQDFVRDGLDVAIRCEPLSEPSVTRHCVGNSHRILVASPDYLKRHGEVLSPVHLEDHSIIVGPSTAPMNAWAFEREGETMMIRVNPKVTVNVNNAAVTAAAQGLGVAMSSIWACRSEMNDGSLIQILDDWKLCSVEVNAVYPAGHTPKPAARAFIDYLANECPL